MKDLEVLNTIKEVKIGDETIIIRELSWPDALAFLKKLAERAGQFTVEGKLVISPDKLTDVITSGQDLSEWLVCKSTNLTPEWLSKRSFSEGLDLVEASLSMNLRPDFFEKLKRIGARFMGANLKESPQPSTSSSGKATAEQT